MNVFDFLVLDREALIAGQWWRLWTGHLAHTGPEHLLGNLVALIALMAGARLVHLIRACLVYALLATPLISIGLLVMLPWLEWYAGLSGLLHGLLVLMLARIGRRPALIGLGLLAAKVTLESQGLWPVGASEHAVIWQAHALGAVGGMVVCCRRCCLRSRRLRSGSRGHRGFGRNRCLVPPPAQDRAIQTIHVCTVPTQRQIEIHLRARRSHRIVRDCQTLLTESAGEDFHRTIEVRDHIDRALLDAD